jgi:hypothetical protein
VSLKNRQQLLLVVAAVGFGLFLADRLILTPLTSAWKQRDARITELRTKVDRGRSLLRREDSLRSRWQYMLTNTLPTNPSLAEQQVLNSLDRWANDSRLAVLSLSPQWKRDSDDFVTLECRLEGSGNLSALNRFLYDLEKDPAALKLQALEINSRDDGQQFALGLQISGLVLTPKEAAR